MENHFILFDAEAVEALFDALDRFASAVACGTVKDRLDTAGSLQAVMQHLRARYDLAEGPEAC